MSQAQQIFSQGGSTNYWYERALLVKESSAWEVVLMCCNRVLSIDKTDVRGWYLSALAHAHLADFQNACEAVIGAEKFGRPFREEDCFGFYTLSEHEFLLNFFAAWPVESNRQQGNLASGLVQFYARNLAESRVFFLPLLADSSENNYWARYFLSRIEHELGQYDAGKKYLDLKVQHALWEVARVHFWLAKLQLDQALVIFKKLSEEPYPDPEDDYFYDEYIYSLFAPAVDSLKTAIAVGPVRAEYYFRLGQACQHYGKRGAGFEEYHEAVKLDPQNGEYVLARVSALYDDAWEFRYWGESSATSIVAYADAAALFPTDTDLILGAALAYQQVGSYAAALELFDKLDWSTPDENEDRKSLDKMYVLRRQECIDHLGYPLPDSLFQAIIKVEREYWKKLADADNTGRLHD